MIFLILQGQKKNWENHAGGDLLQGNITLPVLYAMEDNNIRSEIIKVHENMSRKEIDRIIKLINIRCN